jgi:hypothetical protein
VSLFYSVNTRFFKTHVNCEIHKTVDIRPVSFSLDHTVFVNVLLLVAAKNSRSQIPIGGENNYSARSRAMGVQSVEQCW